MAAEEIKKGLKPNSHLRRAPRVKRRCPNGPVASGLGLAACQKGYSVAFTTPLVLVHELMEARDERRLRALQKHHNAVRMTATTPAPLAQVGGVLPADCGGGGTPGERTCGTLQKKTQLV